MAEEKPSSKSNLDDVLSLFAEVRAGEGRQLILLLVNIFLILFGYYILKTVREGLLSGGFLGLSSLDGKIVVAGLSAALLFVVVPVYSRLVDALSRVKLLNVSMGFVVVSLGVFLVLIGLEVNVGAAFYLWLSIVNVFLIAQFWSYANDLYSEAEGKRLFAVIAIGGSAGAILGPLLVGVLGESNIVLLLTAAGVFAAVTLLYNVIDFKAAPQDDDDVVDETTDKPSKNGAFGLVFKSKYLLLIAAMAMLTNIVNTTGEFILFAAADSISKAEHPDSEFESIADKDEREAAKKKKRGIVIKKFYASFFFWVNLVGFILQAFVVSRIFKFLGVRAALFILPIIAFGGYALIGAIGAVLVIRVAKTAENATDYSLQNTVKQALYLPTNRDVKYKAKAAIDTFFVRGGDLLASAISFGLTIGLGFGLTGFAFVNVGFVALWLVVTLLIAREHKKISKD